MSQLDEANEIIKRTRGYESNNYNARRVTNGLLDKYYDKYLKPKDPLFEKFETFHRWYYTARFNVDSAAKELYPKFKEIFKEELNGTKGLDYLEKAMDYSPSEGNGKHWLDWLDWFKNHIADTRKRLEEK